MSYYPKDYLLIYNELDGIVIGEGEQTFYELVRYYLEDAQTLDNINGIAFRDSARLQCSDNITKDEISITPPRKHMSLDELPFAYENMEEHKNKIIYYESSRGCPYSCSYCLSSAHRGVRYQECSACKERNENLSYNKVLG